MKKIISLLLAIMLILPCFSMVSISAEGEAEDKIIGATLNLGSTLTIDYYATVASGNENAQMKFTSSSERTLTVSGVYDEKLNAYKYSYTGINPQCMSDTIKAELILDGNVLATKEDYSVKAYCDNQIKKNADALDMNSTQFAAFRALLADVLVYGGASQKYKEYNTENLADASQWVADYKTGASNPVGVRNVTGNSDANNKVKSVGLNMANVNKIYFKLIVSDDAIVKLNGKVVDVSTLKKDGNTRVLYTDGIKATQFDDVYTLTIEKGEEVISKVEYNVNAYIQNKKNDATVGEIVNALYNYGYSAEKYIKAMNEQDADFDLGDEDVLDEKPVVNLVANIDSTFEGANVFTDTSWGKIGSVSSAEIVKDEYQGNVLKFTKPATTGASYYSVTYDIAPLIKNGGEYTISFKYKVTGAPEAEAPFDGVMRTESATSFVSLSGGNYLKGLGGVGLCEDGIWYDASFEIGIEQNDIGQGGKWRFCLHNIYETVTEIYIDDFKIIEKTYDDIVNVIDSAETWVANELVLVSDTWYSDAYNTVDVDLMLTNGEVTYKIPGFWDGGKIWKVRFVCPTEGTWTYTTVCSDTENVGLHNITNTLTCTKYSGDLDVYKHGFVTIEKGKKYFTYADGTPFFYLGDTHWSLGGETVEMVETIAKKRANQGYTVYQSEPLGVKFDLTNGISVTDISGLREFDEKFKAIAEVGLTHANAQFFFPSGMTTFVNNFGGYSNTVVGTLTHSKDLNEETGTYEHPIYDLADETKEALNRLSRYWVARYSAYPVMWTMAQEIDNDFFWQNSGSQGHAKWAYVNNPFKYVAEYVGAWDPYKHPLSAHMEHSGFGANNTVADSGDPMTSSAFSDVSAHNWYAAQWKSLFNGAETEKIAKIAENFWNSEKVAINYEGKYWMLSTKDYGVRAQAWGTLLSGMYGHGWGGQDTWCYKSTYDESVSSYYGTSSSYLDVVTPEEKQAMTWEDALYSNSSNQMVIMKNFFEDTVGDWWNLIPRFENTAYLTRESKKVTTGIISSETVTSYAVIASNSDNSEIVTYFYNYTDASVAENANTKILDAYWSDEIADGGTLTGTFGNLTANATYNYKWFNPITGEYTSEGTFTADSNGKWAAGAKATSDMVLYISKA